MKTEKEKKEEEEEDLRPFRIHAYSKEELAMLYNPTYCISNAIYTLAAWIRHNKALKGELEKVYVVMHNNICYGASLFSSNAGY